MVLMTTMRSLLQVAECQLTEMILRKSLPPLRIKIRSNTRSLMMLPERSSLHAVG